MRSQRKGKIIGKMGGLSKDISKKSRGRRQVRGKSLQHTVRWKEKKREKWPVSPRQQRNERENTIYTLLMNK